MTEPTNPNLVDEQRLRSLIDQLSDQMCQAVDGRFDFAVRIEVQDETIEKLQMLINFVLDAARRSLTEIEAKAHALEAKTLTLSSVNMKLEREITERLAAEAELLRSERELVEMTDELVRQKAQLVDEISQRMGAEATARDDAMHDSLTGLSNRAVLLEQIESCLHRTKREKGFFFALLYLDFDRFKLVNDSLGHEVGDKLLISIADRLQGSLRAGDTTSRVDQELDPENDNLAVRLGGDEFVILLDGIKNVADASLVADRLQKLLEAPHKIGSHEVTSTASIGIVTSDFGYNSADEMLRDADTAMYSAKAAGKAQHKVFDKTMHEQAINRLQLEIDLRTALQKEQFRLLYQPIVELETGQIIGFEALIRWEHPTRGLISPIDFIPVAEETGLIVPIGGWVLLEATQQLKKWQTQFPRKKPLSMNVNISKRQLIQPDLVNTIQNVLRSFDIPAYTLKLEVTESAIMSDMEQLTPILQSLRSLGLHLCIDDFGTGHSSLSCLHMFAIDILKIDRYFLETMGEGREYAAVMQAIVTLAHNLGMDVVAEGVETADQVALLQSLGTDHAQGYFFARPIKPEEIEALLQKSSSLAMSAA
ncbi:MAG: bifunctional diguanylate cyclase/phosphodiesterase [Planctomycetes bacterium]|nr:bifunctional diguanylate cyclase/phosphodiesterase [Planctomycetota bacterium]